MRKKPDNSSKTDLRRQAEVKLGKHRKKAAPVTEADSLRLVHELQVHQIELEMQNEELEQARAELETLLRQYTDLYDFAPVGYFTLARNGTIRAANLAGANLLGVERRALIKRRFGLFVSVESRPAFKAFLENLLSGHEKRTCELALLKNGNTMFWARLEAAGFEGGQECRAALMDITERKLAEEKLRQSEGRIRYVLDNMVEGSQIISKEWRYLYVNDAVAIQGRHTPQELLGHTMLEMYPGIETTELFASLQHCMEDRVHHQMLNEFTYPDGSQGWFELSIQPVPEGIFILSNDITERKQAEEKLRQSEEHLRLVTLATQDAIYDWDIPSGNVFRNEAYQALFSPNEPVGTDETWWERQVYPDDFERILGSLRNTFRKREPGWSGEYRFRRHDGTYASVIDRGYIMYDADGQAIRMIGSILDFTERKQAEELLRESEERYRDLVEISPNAVLVQSEEQIVFVNPAALKLLGAAHSGQLIGKSIWEFNHPDYHQIVRERIQKLAEGQGVPRQAGKFIRLDGATVEVEIISTQLVYQNQPAVQIIAQDITERKQAEEALHESQERFRSLSEAAFEGIMIHDRGIILDTNQAFADLFGFHRPDELIGRNGLEILPLTAESLEKIKSSIRVSLLGAFEIEVVRSDGSTFPAETQGGDMIYRGHKVRIVAVRDITERKQAEGRQTILYETLHAVGAHLKPFAAASAAVEVLGRLGNWVSASISVANLDGQTWTTRAGTGILVGRFGQPRTMNQGVIGRTYRTGQMQLVPDVSADSDYFVGADQPALIRSELAMPIKHNGQVLGVLNLESAALNAFSPDDVSLAKSLADAMALAFENARLYASAQQEIAERKQAEAELQAALMRVEALYAITRVSISSISLSNLLQEMVESVAYGMPANRATLITFDQQPQQVKNFVRGGPGADYTVSASYDELMDGLSGWAIRTGQSVLSLKGAPDPRESAEVQRRRTETNCGSILVTPLHNQDQILGTLTAINLPEEPDFTDKDVVLLETIASQVTTAIIRAILYESLQHANKALSDRTIELEKEITERKQVEESLHAAHSELQAQFAEIEKLQIELREQAIRDPLTGLYNRRYLFEALALEVPRAIREGYPISIILLDIDHFKIINDTFGHDAGDMALQVLAAQLQSLARAEDIVCRYGGDEHLIVMHNTTAEKAVERADQLREAIAEKRVSHMDKSFQFTSSFGVAVFPIHAPTIEGVISRADRALYQSKKTGRNRVTLL